METFIIMKKNITVVFLSNYPFIFIHVFSLYFFSPKFRKEVQSIYKATEQTHSCLLRTDLPKCHGVI